MSDTRKLRELPAVHEVVERLGRHAGRFPRTLVVAETRRVLEGLRAELLAGTAGAEAAEERVGEALAALEFPSLRRVINATGVVLHTNLGRAPLRPLTIPGGYSNLEYDLAAGRRGKRDTHIAGLLERLLGAPGIAVNNNAAAVFLALNELAAGGEVLVSRGELIEIGDGFRIPDIMARSGAVAARGGHHQPHPHRRLPRGHRRAHAAADAGPSAAISGSRDSRRTPALGELTALGRERGLPVYEDLGSGCVTDLRDFGIDEPLVSDSLEAGVDLVSFSGDKLLGGPQAGILAGKAEIVARLRRNPLFRALRLDKLIYQVLETTLRDLLLERWDEIPALAMIRQAPRRDLSRGPKRC